MDPKNFAPRLKELREQAGMTQQELAEKAGMNRFGIAQLEQGRNKPSWDTVIALCQALGVSCDAFLKEPTTDAAPRPRGRPRKADADQPAQVEPKPKGKNGRAKG